MKKYLFISVMIALLIAVGISNSYALTAHSRSQGGDWNEHTTWVEDFVPGPNDTAYITSPVIIGSVNAYEIYHSYGGWVIVEPNGQLLPHEYGGGLGIFIFYIEHDIINNGRLTNAYGVRNEELLNINVKGNVTNNNYWRAYQTDLSGTSNQNLTLAEGKTFGGIWACTNPHSLTALSDLTFDCMYNYQSVWYTADFDLNGSTLHMGNYSINATGTLIYDGIFEGDFEILGKFRVNKYVEDTLVFVGNVTVTDTLESTEYGGGYGIQKLKIIGNIINNGVVRDREDVRNADDLSILITGDITNNGKWTCNFVNFIGTETQYIQQNEGTEFVSDFKGLDASNKIVANSDITNLQNIDLDGSILDMQGHTLLMEKWLTDGTVQNVILNGAYLQSITIADALTIQGVVTVDNFVTFECPVTVEGTLRSNTYGGGAANFDLAIDGNITNNGSILNIEPGHWLRLYITGNIVNNGEWMNYTTFLTGSNGQTISQASGKYFGCDFESLKTNGNIIASTDLNLTGSFNLNGSALKMEGKTLTLDSWLYSGILDDATMNGGILQGINATTQLTIKDKVIIDDNNQFNCPVTVMDTMVANTYGGGTKMYDLTINGSLTNYGLISNSNSGLLNIYITGNLSNAGMWLNYLTYVNINGSQYIELIDDKQIDGAVKFDAIVGTEPFQWYFEGVILDSPDFEGETSEVLVWNVPVSPFWYGNFSCQTGTRETIELQVKKGYTDIPENNICNAKIWAFDKFLNIDLQEANDGEVVVYDLMGRKITSFPVNPGLTKKLLSNTGYYIVCINADNKTARKKIFVK